MRTDRGAVVLFGCVVLSLPGCYGILGGENGRKAVTESARSKRGRGCGRKDAERRGDGEGLGHTAAAPTDKAPADVVEAAALALVGVVAFFGVAIGMGAAAERPEEPVASLDVADAAPDLPVAVADEAAQPPDTASASAPAAGAVAPAVLDGASGTADVNLFDASGAQRAVDPSEVPAVAAALEAFRSAGCNAGFVVYDFASQRGLGCNADAAFSSASTIKAPFVTYVAQALVDEEGRRSTTRSSRTRSRRARASWPRRPEHLRPGHGAHGYHRLLRQHRLCAAPQPIQRGLRGVGGGGRRGRCGLGWRVVSLHTPRELAKLWLGVGGYLRSGGGQASFCEGLLAQTGTSFIREVLGSDHQVLSKAGYEIDTPLYDMGALDDAGIVRSAAGDYLVAVMSDADYDDAYFTDNEPLILNLIAALDEAHDRLLAA